MPRLLAIVLDIVAVIVFAIAGRASHAEALDPGQIGRTAAPFLAAALMAWVFNVMRPVFRSPWQQGGLVWGVTLVLGMVFRLLLGAGVQASFVLVAALVLAALMFGWRGLAALVARRGGASR